MVDCCRQNLAECYFRWNSVLKITDSGYMGVGFVKHKLIPIGKLLISILCFLVVAAALAFFVLSAGASRNTEQVNAVSYSVMDRYDMFITNTVSDALDGVMSIKKVYWLNDDELVAPEPNQDNFGSTDDPSTLQWFLDDAQELLEGQDTLFSTDVKLFPGSTVNYYLDETIMVITWKQVLDNSVYTISEVKIADPSQFRRFLADGVYASSSKYVGREMAASVNAVVASSGDFYAFRDQGIIVYDNKLMRMEGRLLDTCFIDGNGDIQFAHRTEMMDRAETEKFVEDEGVRFSLAFGPILVEDGEVASIPAFYPVGEGDIPNPRAILGQLDTLHYLLVAVSAEPPYEYGHTLDVVAENMKELGCIQAYNLDGGGTATIVMNDKLINYVYERLISDIIYFATAVPNGE